MDRRRRRQLRQKYLEEEERLGKMSRGLSYDDGDNDENFNADDNEKVSSRFAPRVPKYKARTFKNILRDFDDPDFDESQIYGQKYQREEIAQEEPEDAVAPQHLTVPTKRSILSKSNESEKIEESLDKVEDPLDKEVLEAEKIQDGEEATEEELENQDETEKIELKSEEDDYQNDYDLDINETETITEDEDDIDAPLPPDYRPQPIKRKKTLRQMEAEDLRRHAGKSRPQNKSTNFDSNVDSVSNKKLQKRRGFSFIRFFAFIGFIMLAFLCGYYLCGTVLGVMHITPGLDAQIGQQTDNLSMPKQSEQDNNAQQKPQGEATPTPQNGGDVKSYTIFVPKSGALTSINVELKPAASSEQMLKGVLNVYLDSTKEAGLLSSNTELSELWIAGNTVYLSMNQNFMSDLRRLNVTNATLLMRGFLRTINTNMSSIKKLKMFVDSQEITDTHPIDLTRTWETM